MTQFALLLPIESFSACCRRQNAFDSRIGFRVDGGRIQRVIAAVVNTQEARTVQTLSAPDGSPSTVAGDSGTDRSHRAGRRCFAPSCVKPATRVSSSTEAVFKSTPTAFTVFDHRIRFTGQLGLADIVLMADAMDFRIDFHQFRQRITERRAIETTRAAQGRHPDRLLRAASSEAEYTDAPLR